MSVRHSLMVVGTADRNLIVFNLQNPQTEYKRIVSPLKHQTRCVAAFPDQQGFLVGSIEGRVGVQYLHEDAQENKSYTFKCQRQNNDLYSVNSLNLHPVHHTFASTGSDGAFNFWEKDSAVSPYLAVHSIMMVPYMLTRFVMIGAKVQKITIQLSQRTTFICSYHSRRMRLKASHELEQGVKDEVWC
ncbi:protein RAE1 [Trifolium repens]|nr:protein RAE1 [Trifolium repens]KAK2458590.1 protein RAE1 [Trifolium repens]